MWFSFLSPLPFPRSTEESKGGACSISHPFALFLCHSFIHCQSFSHSCVDRGLPNLSFFLAFHPGLIYLWFQRADKRRWFVWSSDVPWHHTLSVCIKITRDCQTRNGEPKALFLCAWVSSWKEEENSSLFVRFQWSLSYLQFCNEIWPSYKMRESPVSKEM